MKFEFSRQMFEKVSNIKFHQKPSSGSRVVPFVLTDMTKLIVAFRILRTRLKTRLALKPCVLSEPLGHRGSVVHGLDVLVLDRSITLMWIPVTCILIKM
jgi:hypothetical protein